MSEKNLFNLKNGSNNKKPVTVITIVTAVSIFLIALLSVATINIIHKNGSSWHGQEGSFAGSNSGVSGLKIEGAIDIIPISSDSTGVDVNSGFKILLENKQPKSLLEKALTISPEQPYEIKEVSDREFIISFSDALKPNTIYKISLASDPNYSWAFQTKKSFGLVSTLPRNKSSSVPVDSGIELTFTHEGVENISQYFEISPKVSGTFLQYRKTVVFLPDKLDYGTVYTVTVKKGLKLKDSDQALEEDYTFTFETQKSPEQRYEEFFSFSDLIYNFTPDVEPILQVYAGSSLENRDLLVEIYKYSDTDDLLENLRQIDYIAYQAYGRDISSGFSTAKLQKVREFETRLIKNNRNYLYNNCLVFPSPLPEGHYLVNVKTQNKTYQTHIQVNDMAVYVMAGTGGGLAWVNSSSTGKPVEGAFVSFVSPVSSPKQGPKSVKTDKDGIAVIPEETFNELYNLTDPNERGNQMLFVKISNGSNPDFLAPISYNTRQYGDNIDSVSQSAQKYWSYLYTDRDLYLPEDAIQIWGLVKPRDGSSLSPSKATLSLHRSEYAIYRTDYDYEQNSSLSEILSKEVKISENGTFICTMELPNLNAGNYFIRLTLGDEIIVEKYFNVRQYTKPVYKIDITTDKKVMFEWEKLNADIQASFFEGSPVSGMDLKYSYYGSWTNRREGSISCDENGMASLDITPSIDTVSWRPAVFNIHVSNANAEETEISSSSQVYVFPRDTMIEVNASSRNSSGLIEIKTSHIDIEKLRTQPELWHDEDMYRGTTTDIPLKIRIYRQHWEREEIGQYYDFISKKVEKEYRYYEVKKLVEELSIRTKNGEYSYEFPFDTSGNYNYYIEVEGADSRRKPILEKAYLYRYAYPQYEGADIYTLDIKNAESYDGKFKLGDTVNLVVKKNNLELPAMPGNRFLYVVLKNGMLSYSVTDEPDFSLDFTKEYIPNIYVKGVYFDGKNIFNAGQEQICYDYKEKELKIDIKTDKQEYRPGDTVQLEIEVKDAQGNPCISEVNISVVDEAFFAIQDQRVDTLSSLYQYCFPTGILAEYVSYRPINTDYFGAPEMGGEGDTQWIRSVFKDTAFFDTIKTDSNGKGKVSFKLPDNLTSWRITYQGISFQHSGTEKINHTGTSRSTGTGSRDSGTDNVPKAGSGKINIPVKLPFFVDVVFNSVFIDGDTVAISARSFGTMLESGKKVEYTVTLQKLADDSGDESNQKDENNHKYVYEKTYHAEGIGNNLTNIELGKLEEGNYSVTVSAKQGEYHDAVKRDFRVVKSLLESTKLEHYRLTEALKPAGGNSLTTLSFYNAGSSTHYNTLLSLLYSWGDRIDRKLSVKIAAELFNIFYGEGHGTKWLEIPGDDLLKSYQQDDGGIALLPYDSSNPEITAKIASLMNSLSTALSSSGKNSSDEDHPYSNDYVYDLFDRAAMKWYFYKTLESSNATKESIAASLWGLAALNEPVLIDIQKILKTNQIPGMQNENNGNNGNIGTKEKLYLGIALADLGSINEARAVYTEIINQYVVSNAEYAYIDSGSERDDTIELTSLCFVLGAKINAPESEKLFKYVQDNSTKYNLNNIEKLIFITHMTPDPSGTGSFTVEVNGRKENVSLDKNKVFRLVLTPEALQNIKFSNIKGDVAVTSSYTASITNFSEDTNKLVRIKRTYSVVNPALSDSNRWQLQGSDPLQQFVFRQSQLVKITLEPEFAENAPDGYYEITDILPSGLRFTSADDRYNLGCYLSETGGQKVVFGFYYNKNSKDGFGQRSISYYARAVTPGQFTADYTYIRHTQADFSGFAEKALVEIKKDDK